MILRAEVGEIGIGGIHVNAVGVLLPEADDLIGIFIGERAKENAVDDGEDGGGGADAESESENGYKSEGGRFFEETEREANVLQESFEHGKTPSVAVILCGLLCAAELDEGAAASFFGRHADAEVFFDGEVEVVGDFGGEVAVELVATEEGEEAMEEAEVHGRKEVKEWKSLRVKE
jgi:hypothetical protein